MGIAYLFCVWMGFVSSNSRHFVAQRSNFFNKKPALPPGDCSFVTALVGSINPNIRSNWFSTAFFVSFFAPPKKKRKKPVID